MVGATVLGVFLQGLPPDRRVAMARVASLIRRAARGVRESKRLGLVFYELSGSPLFALESREKSLTLYVAESSIIEPFVQSIKGFDAEHSLINFTDLNRLPLPDIEKLVRASVVARRDRGTVPSETDLLKLWGVEEESATVAPPIVRISMRTQEEEAAEAAAKEEAARKAAETKRILKPSKPEKSLVQKRAESKAAALQLKKEANRKKAASKANIEDKIEKTLKTAAEKKTVATKKTQAEKKTAVKAAAKKIAATTKSAAKKTTVKKATTAVAAAKADEAKKTIKKATAKSAAKKTASKKDEA